MRDDSNCRHLAGGWRGVGDIFVLDCGWGCGGDDDDDDDDGNDGGIFFLIFFSSSTQQAERQRKRERVGWRESKRQASQKDSQR